ncbi:MAG TPA: hypothetical protein VFB54_06995, partial [Burkholderiales bacterium]|nr:hypothetical protein [Burkholderiales bacterium]
MAFPPRRNSNQPVGAAPAACRKDARFGRLVYVAGWWYGSTTLLGYAGVRLRLPGELYGPAPRAHAAIVRLDEDTGYMCATIEERLWVAFRGHLEPDVGRLSAALGTGEPLGSVFRFVAACAGAQGEDEAIELAFQTQTGEAALIASRAGTLGTARRCSFIWRTPVMG